MMPIDPYHCGVCMKVLYRYRVAGERLPTMLVMKLVGGGSPLEGDCAVARGL